MAALELFKPSATLVQRVGASLEDEVIPWDAAVESCVYEDAQSLDVLLERVDLTPHDVLVAALRAPVMSRRSRRRNPVRRAKPPARTNFPAKELRFRPARTLVVGRARFQPHRSRRALAVVGSFISVASR